MTEAEWAACEDTTTMLESLRGELSERKLRLFACACCRRIGHLLTGRRCWWALEVVERYADKRATDAELTHASDAAFQAFVSSELDLNNTLNSTRLAASAVWGATAAANEESGFGGERIAGFAINTALQAGDAVESQECERRSQADLLRDIFGNPFRPVPFSPSWRTDTAVQLATQMYESREFGAMPVLADALQDAGCDNDDVLNHVRGCWVVDLVLGKE